MKVLSIQSSVSYGHVGNSVAVFILQRLGHEAWPVDTVRFSNHPGYGRWRGRRSSAREVRSLVSGIAERGVFGDCAAVLSGYLGDATVGPVVLEAVRRVHRDNPDALYCCDPVMGNAAKGFFVRQGIPEFFRDQAVARADILIPNGFELSFLTGRAIGGVEAARAAAQALRRAGPRLVVVTGLRQDDHVTVLAAAEAGACRVRMPFVAGLAGDGAGDCFTALFLGNYLVKRDLRAALGRAAAAMHAVMEATRAAGAAELQIVAAQDAIAMPRESFPVETL